MDVNDAMEDIQEDVFGEADEDGVDDTAFDETDDELDEYLDETDDETEEEGDEMTGFPLDDLDDDALKALMKVEDGVFVGQARVHVAKKLFLEADSLYSKGGLRRRKRIAPLVGRVAFSVGRALFRSFSRGRVSRSGSRITQQYHRTGNYGDAVRDFNRLRPDNVRTFNNGRISGQTGTMGNHRVTVRNGSSGNSRPTLEVRSHGGDMVRKFRYEK
nr:hypothetical protein BaRGS_029764 [Batillaria attramentaria]